MIKIPENVFFNQRIDDLEKRVEQLETFIKLMKSAETKVEELTNGDNNQG